MPLEAFESSFRVRMKWWRAVRETPTILAIDALETVFSSPFASHCVSCSSFNESCPISSGLLTSRAQYDIISDQTKPMSEPGIQQCQLAGASG